MANTSIQIKIEAVDNASKVLKRIEGRLAPMKRKVGGLDKEFKNVDKSANKLGNSMGRLKGLIAGAFAVGGAVTLGTKIVNATARAEDLKTTLATVTGSAQGAENAWQFINDFATKTPFDIETLTETFIKLKAAGIEPTEQLLTTFGDTASVTTDRIGSLTAITDLFSRTTAGGLGLEELNRLADRGIPVFDILHEKLGVTRLEVSEMGKTMEGATKIKEALLEGLNENFGGGMEKASKNLSVSLSNLGIAANNALIAVGEGGLGDAINRAATLMQEFIVDNQDLATALGEKLGNALNYVIDNIGGVIDFFRELQPLFELIGTIASEILWPALKLIAEVLASVATAIQPFVEQWAPLAVGLFEDLAGVANDYVIPAFQTLITIIGDVVTAIQNMISWVGEGLTSVKNMAGGVKESVSNGLSAAGEKVSNFAAGAKQSFWDLYDYTVGNSVIPDMVEGIDHWMGSKLMNIVGSVQKFVGSAKNKFWELYDYVVGNSVIPDMVVETGQHMNKLPKKMINPVKEGVEGSKKAFDPLVTGQAVGANNVVSSAMNFNINNVDASQPSALNEANMRKYIEGVTTQVAYDIIRQQSKMGGLAH